MFQLIAHFDAPAPDQALALLAAQPTCRRLSFAQSTDVPERYVLVAEFDTPAGYRQALSPFDVRVTVIPWLSSSLPGSGVHEVLSFGAGGPLRTYEPTVTPGRQP